MAVSKIDYHQKGDCHVASWEYTDYDRGITGLCLMGHGSSRQDASQNLLNRVRHTAKMMAELEAKINYQMDKE
jgi:hypothetical protein